MSTTTTSATTVTASRTITPIDDQYEYYTYGDLRLIHSIKNDYFSASSITKALGSAKEPARWFKLRQTAEMLHGFSTDVEIGGSPLWYDNGKAGVPKHAYNIFMHRLLVPHFASWVSHVYAYKISIILDDHFELQRKVEENRVLEDKNKSLEQKVDELLSNNRKILADNRELLRINKDQSIKLDDISYRLKKTYATVQSIADLPEKLNNNVSSGNTIENVYIYTLPDEGDEESMIIHLSARTDQSLKNLQSKLPKDHIVIDHFTIANAKDCIREIIGEAESYGIVSSVRPTYSISIATDDLDTFKSAIDVILRKLNRSPKIVKRTIETTNKLNPFEYVSEKWSISEPIIKDILKTHSINIETLNSIVKGDIIHRVRGKEYTVKYHDKSPYLCYGKQVDESIKWFFVRPGTLKNPA